MTKHKGVSDKNTIIQINRILTPPELSALEKFTNPHIVSERWAVQCLDKKLRFYRYMAGECIYEMDIEDGQIVNAKVCRDRNIYDYDNDEIDILYLKELINDAIELGSN